MTCARQILGLTAGVVGARLRCIAPASRGDCPWSTASFAAPQAVPMWGDPPSLRGPLGRKTKNTQTQGGAALCAARVPRLAQDSSRLAALAEPAGLSTGSMVGLLRRANTPRDRHKLHEDNENPALPATRANAAGQRRRTVLCRKARRICRFRPQRNCAWTRGERGPVSEAQLNRPLSSFLVINQGRTWTTPPLPARPRGGRTASDAASYTIIACASDRRGAPHCGAVLLRSNPSTSSYDLRQTALS